MSGHEFHTRCGITLRSILVAGLAAVTLGSGAWVGWRWWSAQALEDLRMNCRKADRLGNWQQLETLAEQVTESSPDDGEAWLLRAKASQRLGDDRKSLGFLQSVPRGSAHEKPALLAKLELEFGALNQPLDGIETCRSLLRLDECSAVANERLLFFHALTLQRRELLEHAQRVMELDCEPPEVFVYVFLADTPQYSNGVQWNVRWLAAAPDSELFLVARAVHLAIVLDGAPPRSDEETVRGFRRKAAEKDERMAELLQRFPHNLELLAYHLDQAVQRGDIDRARELLGNCPTEADDDNRFWRFKGWYYSQTEVLDKAEESYRHALELRPLDWVTRHLLSDLLRRCQRFDEVNRLQGLVQRATRLRNAVVQQPNVRSIPLETLSELADYAEDCRDLLYATAVRRHQTRSAPSP